MLIAGHNPGLEDLVESLASNRVAIPPDGKLMPTAAVARLQVAGPWAGLRPAGATLLSLTRPRDLPSR